VPLNVQVRAATAEDLAFIAEMARHACVIENRPLPDVHSEDVQDLLPRSEDIVVVAAHQAGTRVGAVWTFHHDRALMVGSDGVSLPEVGIAVSPEVRGNGVGGTMLDELFLRCTAKYEALTLNVHQRNPAAHLYQCMGFRSMGQGCGALGIAMLKELHTRVDAQSDGQ
jgi:ribosomal protein S18 acetylase RimI-like enzyme